MTWTAPAAGATVNGVTATYFDDERFHRHVGHEARALDQFQLADRPCRGGTPRHQHLQLALDGAGEAQFTETYTFYTRTNDGVRLWVNGQQLIDAWVTQSGLLVER